ncbi:MAG: hypothetical protein QNJ72_09340 [Pleurocapsa sp. MO_226.B13]|nr:hypothetical protein [Pleurocapsa sp. MO_226.B13]
MCEQNHYNLESKAEKTILEKFQQLYTNRDANFGNGRLARNIFEKTIEKQATRLAKIKNLNKEIMMEIVAEDIPE